MGCNCNKNGVPLSIRKEMRSKMKQKIADVKKIWSESGKVKHVKVDTKDLGI